MMGDVRSEIRGLDDGQQGLRRAAFLAVLGGEPTTVDALARRAGADPSQVRELVGRGIVAVDEAGAVVGAAGLSLVPLSDRPHRLRLGGRAWWTWCAVDAVGIPAALGVDAVAETACPRCGAAVTVTFRGGAVAQSSHPQARLWYADHVAGRSVVDGTCRLMNLFCSPEHLEAWRADHPDQRGSPQDLTAAAETGRAWWGPLLEGRPCGQADCCTQPRRRRSAQIGEAPAGLLAQDGRAAARAG
jgi:hypothetical protein